MTKIEEKFIINLQGKQFVTYEGLLDLAHQKGLIQIEVVLIQVPSKENDMTAICMATATTKDGKFTDIGDANPGSVNGMVRPHIIRMASTRAKARALRDLTNIGMTAIEELAEVEGDKPTNNPGIENKSSGGATTSYKCTDCNVDINQAVNEYSTKNLGKALCFNCQKKHK